MAMYILYRKRRVRMTDMVNCRPSKTQSSTTKTLSHISNRSNHIQSAFYFVEQENTFAETDSFNNTTSHLLENNRRKHYTRSHRQRTEQTDNEIAPRIEMPYFKFHVRCSHAPRNVQEIHKGDRVDEILGLLPSLPGCYGQP